MLKTIATKLAFRDEFETLTSSHLLIVVLLLISRLLLDALGQINELQLQNAARDFQGFDKINE